MSPQSPRSIDHSHSTGQVCYVGFDRTTCPSYADSVELHAARALTNGALGERIDRAQFTDHGYTPAEVSAYMVEAARRLNPPDTDRHEEVTVRLTRDQAKVTLDAVTNSYEDLQEGTEEDATSSDTIRLYKTILVLNRALDIPLSVSTVSPPAQFQGSCDLCSWRGPWHDRESKAIADGEKHRESPGRMHSGPDYEMRVAQACQQDG